MRKKNRVLNHDKNHAIAPKTSVNQQSISILNCIINTQDHLNGMDFNLKAFINLAVEQLHYLTRARGTAIELLENNEMTCRAATGSILKCLDQQSDRNSSISGLCMSTHQIICSNDTKNDSRITVDECQQLEARSLAVAPLFHEGNTVGVIKLVSNELNAFADGDIQTLHIFAGLVSSAITRQIMLENTTALTHAKTRALDDLRKSEKKLKHLAQHDYLTGLPNRNLFNHDLVLSLAKAKRKKHIIALMYLDIDNFAQINETMGLAIGDHVLHSFSKRLKQCIRSSDIAARFGGDEFILLIDDIKENKDVTIIADKILHAIRQPFNLNNKSLNVTTSIGIAFLKDKETTTDDFIKQAYQALYVSKSSGRNTFYIFDNDLLYEHSHG